ncbi:MAG: TlpA family protein disulfide reductase [Candidatus Rokubacteria bacterium]|nr:TlpA family protein disulfide reductase [Candidatus Rokubacteria bacterium]MBI2555777.1 TlpA family protein disulfide reductase [Candidatus Rokubacteria bacterium]
MLRIAAVFLALASSGSPVWADATAPAFTLRLLDGKKTLDSRAYLGKQVLVVRFQASWCKLCVREAPGFERAYRKYKPRGVEFVGIQVQDTTADARKFLQAHEASYPAGVDPTLKIANRFGFKGTPFTVVISRKGEMVARIHGSADEARLARALDPLVRPRSR